ncbi:putative acetyltransferase [Rhabdaerophilaceae bacterium]
MNPVLRDGQREDFRSICQIWRAAWEATFPQIDFVARLPMLQSLLEAAEAGQYAVRLALQDGEPAGFTLLEVKSGLLEQIAVHPSYWGYGISDRLVGDAARIADAQLHLIVNQENQRAVRFYIRMGFGIVGEGTNRNSQRPTFLMRWNEQE